MDKIINILTCSEISLELNRAFIFISLTTLLGLSEYSFLILSLFNKDIEYYLVYTDGGRISGVSAILLIGVISELRLESSSNIGEPLVLVALFVVLLVVNPLLHH